MNRRVAHRENAIFALASDIHEYRAISRRYFSKNITHNIAQYRRDIHEYRRDIACKIAAIFFMNIAAIFMNIAAIFMNIAAIIMNIAQYCTNIASTLIHSAIFDGRALI